MSRLRLEGRLAGTVDSDGRIRYDRQQVETFARERVALVHDEQDTRDKLRAEHAEASRRAWRERLAEKTEAREREEKRDSLLERIVDALERLAKR